MPGLNPDSKAGTSLTTLYRGGLFCALEKKFFDAHVLLSKLMRQWGEEGMPANLGDADNTVTVNGKTFRVPGLIATTAALFNSTSVFRFDLGDGKGEQEYRWNLNVPTAQAADAQTRTLHATSSSAVTQNAGQPNELKIGNSAYVSLTTSVERAAEWTSDIMHRFDICANDLWRGNENEDEWLALGGTPLQNVHRSMNRGATWTRI